MHESKFERDPAVAALQKRWLYWQHNRVYAWPDKKKLDPWELQSLIDDGYYVVMMAERFFGVLPGCRKKQHRKQEDEVISLGEEDSNTDSASER